MAAYDNEGFARALEGAIWRWSAEDLGLLEQMLRYCLGNSDTALRSVLRGIADETLAMAFQKGFLRSEAFEEVFVNRYQSRLLRYFCYRTRDPDRAWDLTQEFYAQLLDPEKGKLAAYDPTRPLDRFLAKLWYHDVVNDLRRRRIRVTVPLGDPASSDPGPDEEASLRETELRIEKALGQLRSQEQTVLRMTIRGDRADDIAREMKLEKVKVYRLLFHARRRLEDSLGLKYSGVLVRYERQT